MRQSPYSFCLTILPPPTSTLFPYTTLFRSITRNAVFGQHRQGGLHAAHEGRGFLTAGEVDVSWHRRVIERIHADRERSDRLCVVGASHSEPYFIAPTGGAGVHEHGRIVDG